MLTGFTLVDALIGVVFLCAVYTGWRHGGVASVATLLGVVIGGACGLALAPVLMGYVSTDNLRTSVAVTCVLVGLSVGLSVGARVGYMIKWGLHLVRLRVVDGVVGAIVHGVMALLMCWVVSVPLAALPAGPVAASVRGSRVVAALDGAAPQVVHGWTQQVQGFLSRAALPRISDPLGGLQATPVEAPADSILTTPQVQAVRPSIVEVVSTVEACRKGLEGSGWVIAEDTILTNAHVVAGASSVQVKTTGGTFNATPTFYDADVDIAVLRVLNLGIAPLALAGAALGTGQDAVFMGFPLGGPFDVQNARVRDRHEITGPNIYSTTQVTREVYSLRGLVREGNSGGPLFDGQAQVVGMIFGVATDNPDTGYALTNKEILETIGGVEVAQQRRSAVSTGQCVK